MCQVKNLKVIERKTLVNIQVCNRTTTSKVGSTKKIKRKDLFRQKG